MRRTATVQAVLAALIMYVRDQQLIITAAAASSFTPAEVATQQCITFSKKKELSRKVLTPSGAGLCQKPGGVASCDINGVANSPAALAEGCSIRWRYVVTA